MLSEDAIYSVKYYLTRQRSSDGAFGIRCYLLQDKHGLTHPIYNATVNIYYRQTSLIYLNIHYKDPVKFQAENPKTVNSSVAE
jgi:hypothetical protein